MPEGEREENMVRRKQVHTGGKKTWQEGACYISYTQVSDRGLRTSSAETLGVDHLFMGQVHRNVGLVPNIVLKHCQSGWRGASFSSCIVSNSVSPRQINNMVLGSI